ncbi:MAG: hypothetical protein KAS32_02440 [Candidatus Peribacteraceae bacterium]|nr:hypothetical protein [Candidatus Peribacteraceae bacterium]
MPKAVEEFIHRDSYGEVIKLGDVCVFRGWGSLKKGIVSRMTKATIFWLEVMRDGSVAKYNHQSRDSSRRVRITDLVSTGGKV